MTSTARYGRLTIRDGKLRDAAGKAVQLRGMSLFWSQWGGRFYTKSTVDRLVDDWCVDIVRAALAVEPDGYLVQPSIQLDLVCTVIEAAIARGIYVIVDWHSHRAHTLDAVQAFQELGKRFGRYDNVLWETWNEPGIGLEWSKDIVPHHLTVIDSLRGVGAEGVVICGTPRHSQDLLSALATRIDRSNVCYSLHFYAGTHGTELRAVAERALGSGICVFVSEYGLSEASGDGPLDLNEAARWWRFLEQKQISHVNWSLFSKAESSAALKRVGWGGRWSLSKSGKVVRRMLRSHANGH